MTQEQLFVAMILAAGIITLAYFRGRKLNLELSHAISRELESALRPADQTYTWLGGVLGFRADYSGGHMPRVEATLALQPRHSLLYLPIAWLVTGGDRLFLVAHPDTPIRGETHVIARRYRRRLGRLAGEQGWRREQVEVGGVRFEVLGDRSETVAGLRDWLRTLPRPRALQHLALVPRTGTLYLYLRPEPGQVRPMIDRVLTWFTSQA